MNETARRIPSEGPGDEADLIRAAQAGKAEAFTELVRRYRLAIYRIAYGLTRSHQDADDVAQETLIRAYQALSRFRAGEPFLPWLARIAINQSYSLFRHRKRRPEAAIEPMLEAGRQWGTEDDPADHAAQAQEQQLIARAFDRLSPDHRAVLVLRVEQEMSYEDIAQALHVPPGTVMSRLARARADLKKQLMTLQGKEPSP